MVVIPDSSRKHTLGRGLRLTDIIHGTVTNISYKEEEEKISLLPFIVVNTTIKCTLQFMM